VKNSTLQNKELVREITCARVRYSIQEGHDTEEREEERGRYAPGGGATGVGAPNDDRLATTVVAVAS
jgi:hypothetical protein